LEHLMMHLSRKHTHGRDGCEKEFDVHNDHGTACSNIPDASAMLKLRPSDPTTQTVRNGRIAAMHGTRVDWKRAVGHMMKNINKTVDR
jgi:hypothetical protein